MDAAQVWALVTSWVRVLCAKGAPVSFPQSAEQGLLGAAGGRAGCSVAERKRRHSACVHNVTLPSHPALVTAMFLAAVQGGSAAERRLQQHHGGRRRQARRCVQRRPWPGWFLGYFGRDGGGSGPAGQEGQCCPQEPSGA